MIMATVEQIKEKLQNVKYPGFTKSIVDFGFVKDVAIDANGKVSITLEITSSANEVEKELRKSIDDELAMLGIKDIDLTITKPQAPKQASNTLSGKNLAPQIKNFIMVSSGKGGVGKSTTAVNLAIALSMQGKKVGLLDADVYGPNIARMMGVTGKEVEILGNRIAPFLAYGVEVMSMANLVEEGQALIWRGAMIMKAISQLLQDVLWSDLDVLVIDMPPGTGDAQITLAQSVPVAAGINVTTPQSVSLDDSRRSLEMFTKLHIPIGGIIENMSGFVCPKCGEESDIFGMGTSQAVADEYKTDLLARIPIEPAIRKGGDEGKPIVYFHPESESAKRYLEAAQKLWEKVEEFNKSGAVGNAAVQPTTPPGVSACSM
jgi:ATP-binding protein involved in chromosome partitioning